MPIIRQESLFDLQDLFIVFVRNINDGKAAIPLLKGMQEKLPLVMRFGTLDAGYDMFRSMNKSIE